MMALRRFALLLPALVGLACCGDAFEAPVSRSSLNSKRVVSDVAQAKVAKLGVEVSRQDIMESGYARPHREDGERYGDSRSPMVEAFPATITVPSDRECRVTLWVINNEEDDVVLARAKFSCGCIGAEGVEGRLLGYGNREISVRVAAEPVGNGGFVAIPFTWKEQRWEVVVRIQRV